MWIESHQSLRSHPKTIRAARALGIPVAHLIGHLHCMWWWAMDYAPNGDLSSYEDTDIAAAAEWDGDAAQFVAALAVAAQVGERPGFLERQNGFLQIHDWWDYAGKLIAKREQDAARKRDRRSGKAPQASTEATEPRPLDVQRTSSGRPADVAGTKPTIPTNNTKPTGPDTTKPTPPNRAGATSAPTNGKAAASAEATLRVARGGGAVVATLPSAPLTPEQHVAVEYVRMVAPDFRDIEAFVQTANARQVAFWALSAGEGVERIDNPAGLIRSMVQKDQWPNIPLNLIDNWKRDVRRAADRARAV